MRDTAESLISEIRYQYPLGQTTWGYCYTEGCDNTARGSRRCALCLERELGALIGDAVSAWHFHTQTASAHNNARRIVKAARVKE